MKQKIFRNRKTKDFVFEEDIEEYVLDQLGITVEPKGKNGELTEEQILMINNTIEDYLYSEWNEEYIEMEEI
jgi:hypothetical protein